MSQGVRSAEQDSIVSHSLDLLCEPHPSFFLPPAVSAAVLGVLS